MTAPTVTVVEHPWPTCGYPGCGAALRLSKSLAAGMCCCHRFACDDEDHYVDPIELADATAWQEAS